MTTDPPSPRAAALLAAEAVVTATREAMRAVEALPHDPNEQVWGWKVCSDPEYGGMYCAEPDCGCDGHGTELLACEDGDGEPYRFTLVDLHDAIAQHIMWRAEQRAEEAEERERF